jgi:V8-like Glu-specific endopeptidase
MTRWSTRLIVALALALLAASVAAGATGDRALVTERQLDRSPYRGIVLVTVGSRSLCTGFVLSARKVVTAAHCLTRNPQEGDYRLLRGLPGIITIYRGYSAAAGGEHYPACRVSQAWAHSRFIRSGAADRRTGDRGYDVAVLTTEEGCTYPRNAFLRPWATTLEGGDLPTGTNVKMAGYPADRRFSGMTGLNQWRVRGELQPTYGDGQMLYLTGFVAQGMSGSPVWRAFRGESPCGRAHCVVGIVTECSVNSDGTCKLGDSIRRAVRITPTIAGALRRH